MCYRLFNIDIIICKTLVDTILTALLAVVEQTVQPESVWLWPKA